MKDKKETAKNEKLFSVENSHHLDNVFRRLIQNPKSILKNYVKEGMIVLELGCGPGYFTPEIARRVGKTGKVIAADLQEGMLQKLKAKIEGTELEKRIELHKCEKDRIGVTEQVDLALAFSMMHEVEDKKQTLNELKSILRPNGRLYMTELVWYPPKKDFQETVNAALEGGFKIAEKPRFLFTRATVFKIETEKRVTD